MWGLGLRVDLGSVASGVFGLCVICVHEYVRGVLDHSEIRDCAVCYIANQTAVGALGQIYWPGNHGSQ